MKLYLLSAGITLTLMLAYLVVAVIVVVAASPDPTNLNPSAIAMVDLPFRGPKFVYYYFFPPTAAEFSTNPEDINAARSITAIVLLIANLLLYSLPVYMLLRLVRSQRRNRAVKFADSPPPPPAF